MNTNYVFKMKAWYCSVCNKKHKAMFSEIERNADGRRCVVCKNPMKLVYQDDARRMMHEASVR